MLEELGLPLDLKPLPYYANVSFPQESGVLIAFVQDTKPRVGIETLGNTPPEDPESAWLPAPAWPPPPPSLG